MKLLRWAMAGASAYVVYKYTIGKKGGEEVFKSPELGDDAPAPTAAKPARPRRAKKA